MNFNYSQIFLLAWIIAFWIYYGLTYGKDEAKHEKSLKVKYKTKAKWGPFFGLAFFGWTILIIIYFFHYDCVNWLYKISFLDNYIIKIIALLIMCFAFLLNILFTRSVGRFIKISLKNNEKPKLVTTGIYRYIRNPGYLAFSLAVFGTFLIIPNIPALGLLLYTIIVIYGHTIEEEKKLRRVFEEEYEQYKNDVGRFLPKIKIGNKK